MAKFKITGPDGKVYRVTGDNAEGAFQALQQHLGTAQQPSGQSATDAMGEMSAMTRSMDGELPGGNLASARYEALPGWKKPFVAAADTADLLANGASFGFGNKLSAAIRSPFTDKTYAEELEAMRAQTDRARDRAGAAGFAAELGGAVAAPVGLASRGVTLAGRFGTGAMTGAKGLAARTGLMAAEGAGYGGLTAGGNDQDIAEGAALGLVGGALGNVAGEGLSALGQKASRAYRLARATPEERAAGQVYDAAQRIGAPEAMARINELGPEAMALDALGKRGTALARKASNLSPEARETLDAAVLGRKAGQNTRLASDIEAASGLPAGNRTDVGELKSAAYKKAAPAINEAYEAARAAGADLPRTPFQEILDTPMGARAYEDAAESLLNRNATQGFKANSELARLDETKRILDSKASAAYRAGDNNTGEQASSLAKLLRERMDDSIAGEEYAAARGLRREAYQTDASFDLGEQLAGRNIPLGLPGQAAKVSNPEAMRQAYGASLAQRILNGNATDGALNALSTPMAKEAATAVLGDNAPTLANALARERAFNMAARDVTGNSTTARQVAEMLGTGTGVGGAAMLFGYDPTTSGLAGFLAGAMKRGAPALARKVATEAEKKAAPHLAEILTRRALPTSRPIPEGALERLSKSKRDALVRMIMGGSVNQLVAP